MSRKQLTILLVIGLIVGIAGWITHRNQSKSYEARTGDERQKVFPEFEAEATRITVRDGANEVNLVVQDDTWSVQERNNYPADFSQIRELMQTLVELQPVRSLNIKESLWHELELAEPGEGSNTGSGTLITFYNESDEPSRELILGKEKTQERSGSSRFGGSMPVGRYIRTTGENAGVWLVEETFRSIEADPAQWLNTDRFFEIDKIRSITLKGEEKGYDWRLSRKTENGDWQLEGKKSDEELDSSSVSSLGNVFSSPSFNDVLTGSNALEGTGLDRPTVATIATFDDFTYTLKIGDETDGGDYPLQVEVSAELPPVPPKPDASGQGESGEKAAEKRKEAAKRRQEIQELHDKLEQEQTLGKWTYLVPSYTVSSLLKKREELLADDVEDEGSGPQDGTSGPPTSTQVPSPGSGGQGSLIPSEIPTPGGGSGQDGPSSKAPSPPAPEETSGDSVSAPAPEEPSEDADPKSEGSKTDADSDSGSSQGEPESESSSESGSEQKESAESAEESKSGGDTDSESSSNDEDESQ